ncbi:MAG: hypothetical protein ACHQX3_01005 [Nitrospirales bacterium]
MEKCVTCGGDNGVSAMTDGRQKYPLCDECRPLVVTFFHVYGNMQTAVDQVRQTKGRS